MTGRRESWERIREAFDRAIDLEEPARASFLAELDERDPELASEVRSLLAADSERGGILDVPVFLAAPGSELPRTGEAPHEGPGAGPAVSADQLGARTGQRVGPYRVGRLVGRGGMGDVYLAEREIGDFRQRVALKMIRRGMDSTDVTRRFHEERRILAGLEHDGVARLLDGGVTEDGQAWFSMEFVEGTPITTWCSDRSLDVRRRVMTFLGACDAVQHAHQRLVVHRDLKPSNILVTEDGAVKLLDFGIAKALDRDEARSDATLTRGLARLLTPRYAAPEQLRGETVTVATDVYAMGVVLYEVLSGTHPHATALAAAELEQAVLSTTPRLPSRAAAEAPAGRAGQSRRIDGDLDNICMMALRKEPARRYPSVEALREDLERFLRGEPVVATPDSRGYRLRKFVGRHRGGVLGAAAALVMLAAVTGAFTARLATERDRARLEAANAAEVVDFLEGLFEVSDPFVGTDREVTARQILDEGAARLETELAGQPALQARMLHVVGNVYRGLGLRGEARTRLEEALELSTSVHGPQSLEVAQNLLDLGSLLVEAGEDLALADSLLRRAAAIRERTLGPGDPEVARAWLGLSVLSEVSGQYEEAERFARQALVVLRNEAGADNDDVGTSLHHLALALRQQGELEEAERIGREALRIRRQTLDPAHPDLQMTMGNLALVLEQLGEYPEAEALLEERARLTQDRLGPSHPRSLVAMNNLAYMLWRTGRYDDAEAVFRAVIAGATGDSLGARSPNRPNLAIFLNNLAVAVLRRGDLQAADSLQREAIALDREVLGERHPRVAAGLANLARIQLQAGDLALAERLHRDALAIRLALFPAEHPNILESRSALAAVLRRQGRFDEAEASLGAAVAALRDEGPVETPQAIAAVRELALVRQGAGRIEAAEELLREVIDVRTEILGRDHPQVAESLRELATLLRLEGRQAESEPLLLEARAIASARLHPDDPVMVEIVQELADLYDGWPEHEVAPR